MYNIDELKKELTLCQKLGSTRIYVYCQGINYPFGKLKENYTCHTINGVLEHIKEYQYITHKQKAFVEWNPDRGFRLD